MWARRISILAKLMPTSGPFRYLSPNGPENIALGAARGGPAWLGPRRRRRRISFPPLANSTGSEWAPPGQDMAAAAADGSGRQVCGFPASAFWLVASLPPAATATATATITTELAYSFRMEMT